MSGRKQAEMLRSVEARGGQHRVYTALFRVTDRVSELLRLVASPTLRRFTVYASAGTKYPNLYSICSYPLPTFRRVKILKGVVCDVEFELEI